MRDELYMGNPTESDLRVARSLAAGWDGIILKRGRLEFTRALGCRRAVCSQRTRQKSRFDGSVSRAVGQALAASRDLPKWALGREARSDGPAFCWASPAGPAEPGYLAHLAWWSWASAAGPPGWATLSAPGARGASRKVAWFLPSGSSLCFLNNRGPRCRRRRVAPRLPAASLWRGESDRRTSSFSTGPGLDENLKEAMLVRFLGPAGEPEVRLLDLAELHLPDSKDAKSLDASILRLKECAKCMRLNALGALWKV